jgi:membrane associated rhomboid family serine protease
VTHEKQVWRWITAPFASQGLLNVLIGVLVFGQMGGPFEVRSYSGYLGVNDEGWAIQGDSENI